MPAKAKPAKEKPGKCLATIRHRAYDDPVVWDSHATPRTWQKSDWAEPRPHFARTSAIFVVHGMGHQQWQETSALLRVGFEDALEKIRCKYRQDGLTDFPDPCPSPFIHEGFWANYTDFETTFDDVSRRYTQRERDYFRGLWEKRSHSTGRTLWWFIKKQFSLLIPRNRQQIPRYLLTFLTYSFLQIVGTFTLLGLAIHRRRLITDFLADVRLYCDPQGEIEKAIVQRIDKRVGAAFLRMIGLDWDFHHLPDRDRLMAREEIVDFKRVVWVAHSLGTVISYNVLSDLDARATELAGAGDEEQKANVKRFYKSLRRFVTMGSPLDKIAYLFGKQTLRPWPAGLREKFKRIKGTEYENEWWINFYHVLDPVSGTLNGKLICGEQPPLNLHSKKWSTFLGFAHLAYWKDMLSLRYILSRTYGKEALQDEAFNPVRDGIKHLLAALAYLMWFIIFGLIVWGVIALSFHLVKFLIN